MIKFYILAQVALAADTARAASVVLSVVSDRLSDIVRNNA